MSASCRTGFPELKDFDPFIPLILFYPDDITLIGIMSILSRRLICTTLNHLTLKSHPVRMSDLLFYYNAVDIDERPAISVNRRPSFVSLIE